MKIKNIRKMEYFTATDGTKITETFGIPSESIKEASVAFAILSPGMQTDEHHHNFLEWYIITSGSGVITINGESKNVAEGDNILISKGDWHTIRTTGNKDLEFYCFCVPAFTLTGTKMKNGTVAKESVEREWK